MNDEQLRPFLNHAAKNRIGILVVAILCLGIGALGFVDPGASLGLKLGLMIPFGALGILFFVVAFRPATSHPVIQLLRNRTNEIVWVYPGSQTVNGVPSQTFINFGLQNGSQKALAIGAKGDPVPLIEIARKAIGHATFGYSPDLEAQFKKDPNSLRHAI